MPKLEYDLRDFSGGYPKGGHVIFDSPVVQLESFADVLICRLENDHMYLSVDGEKWQRFIFKIIPSKEKVKKI